MTSVGGWVWVGGCGWVGEVMVLVAINEHMLATPGGVGEIADVMTNEHGRFTVPQGSRCR